MRSREEKQRESKIGGIFSATLVMWAASLGFEIGVHHRRELLTVVASCFFFKAANWFLRIGVSSDAVFVNTSVSLLHSFLTSSFVMFILVNQWLANHSLQMLEHEQLVLNTWPFAYKTLCFSCGYFAYDQWDMLKYRLYSGWFPSILAHHLILLLCFTLALYRHVTINYLILTLLCEMHSVFLHVRKIRRMAGIRNAERGIVKAEWVLNWLTFILARLIPHVLILVKLVIDAPKFEKGIELPLAFLGMIGMNLLNIGLGIDLMGAYKRERCPPQDHRD